MSVLARLIILVVIAVIPALAIQAYNEYAIRHEREVEVRREALRLAKFADGELDRIVENGRELLIALSKLPLLRKPTAAACSAYLTELKKSFPQYSVIGAVAADGRPFCASVPISPDVNFSDRSYFKEAMESGAFTVGVYTIGRMVPNKVVPFAVPFADMPGRPAGVVYAALDLDWLAAYFADRSLSIEATLVITDREGTLLVRIPDNDRYVGTRFGPAYMQYVGATEAGTDEIVGVDGVRRILGYVPVTVPPQGFYVGFALTKDVAFAAVDRSTRVGFVLISCGFVLALFAAWLGGRAFFSTPISRLVAAAAHWRRADFAVRAEVPPGTSELTLLGGTFNEMAAELEANQRQNAALLATLEERVAERTRALEQEVRQRQKAQAELQQAQKMEAIGQLTGGIAHDFNNLLTAVLGNLEMSRSSVVDARGQRLIEGAIRAAERGAVLTQRLLAFGRRQHLAPEPLDLPALLEGVRDLLSRSIGPAIRLELSVQPDIWPARADRNQLELAVLNLVLNARDAMPLGGVITIAASNRRAEAGDELQPGDYVVIGVIDTGTGMPVKVAARAFEPFFTTKDAGKGSGLGLSMVQGFAAQSGGKVALRSAPGHGTTVEIWLPRAQAGRLVAEAAASAGAATSDGSGRVLVCDDDADVRELVIESLSEAGYEIAAANGGAAALRLIERGERFDAVIIDFAMPEMDGFAVARAIRRLLPDIPLLLITGYIELGADSPDGLALPILKKPFKPAELAARLAELIRGAPRKVVPLRPRQR